MFGRKLKILIGIETDPDIKVSGNFTEYYKLFGKMNKISTQYIATVQIQTFGHDK